MLTVVSRKASTLSLNGVSAAQSDPVTVQMTIDGVLVNMELDTGAAVSVMSKTQFRQLFPSAVVEPTTVKLRTYTGALVGPQGVSSVNVQHGDHSAILPLYVVDHKGPPLLGREWLHAVRLEWAKIWNLNNITRTFATSDTESAHKASRQRRRRLTHSSRLQPLKIGSSCSRSWESSISTASSFLT
ncbi:uncharacterized protein LOC125944458 [Dermacentor silvarum]|uniref:uncharacterized protein LOC125944458 n=1 Tax=Dermacentor silvarum TaxID=543639 RepID=UPI0021011D41|nr:uncharacterized protein LOC125944458 [Dermacentor silvarum]